MALELVPTTAAARARSHPLGIRAAAGSPPDGSPALGAYGLGPEDLHSAYELPTSAPSAQTIALVDAYDDPTAEADLQVYDKEFGLPACTEANHCFQKVNEEGNPSPLPAVEPGWATEISLDIETAHAICQSCKILLVEAESPYTSDLEAAERTAVEAGATEVSNSYGGSQSYDSGGYDYPGVVITASTGDWGYDNWADPYFGQIANYPASSPDVVAVGGTELDMAGGSWSGETAWDEGGSGCSGFAEAPLWQRGVADWSEVGCGSSRAIADVAADSDPYTGVAIYDSTPFPEWETVGGTSLASPLIAATFALAGGAAGVEYPAQTLYAHLGSSSLHDVVAGSNWGCPIDESCTPAKDEANCSHALICNAGQGYDGPTGVGTPDGIDAFEPGSPTPPPTVTEVSPSEGDTAGGTVVTISGTHLREPLFVRFGTEQATVLESTDTSVTVESPGHEPGSVDVTVTGAAGARSATTSADRYAYAAPEPIVTAIDPTEGPTTGGTEVTIGGSGLGEAEYVEFGGYYAPVLTESESSITTTSPAHEAGTVDVTVFGAYGASSPSTASDRYVYAPPSQGSALLTVVKAGSGAGFVSSLPAGISCGSVCSYAFDRGTRVSLTAFPVSGSSFLGWSGGGCGGTGTCEIVPDSDQTIVATFGSVGGGSVPGGFHESQQGQPSALGATAFPPASSSPGSDSRSGCLSAARRAFARASRAVARLPEKLRAEALKQARQKKRRAIARCEGLAP